MALGIVNEAQTAGCRARPDSKWHGHAYALLGNVASSRNSTKALGSAQTWKGNANPA